MIFFKLSKAGYGTLRDVMEMDARMVIQLLHYEKFCADYETAYMYLNKG